jgi:hypothetical protein
VSFRNKQQQVPAWMPVQDWGPGSHVKLTCSKLRILDCNCSLLANDGTEAIQQELKSGFVASKPLSWRGSN